MENNVRKYNSEFRKKLVDKINKLKDKNSYIQLYNIINNDIGNTYSSNMNGIFINLNLLSDNTIDDVITLLNTKLNENN